MERVKAFLKRKQVVISVQTYLIDALGAMAFGLFASLLIGTIFGTLGEKTGVVIFTTIAGYAKSATGAALGVSIAYALKAPTLVLFSAATVGIAGNELGGPVGAYIAAVVGAEVGSLVAGMTKLDIILTPATVILSGGAVGILVYEQGFGFIQIYTAPLKMAFPAVAAILIGGAGVNKASIANVIIGTFLYQGLVTMTPTVINSLIHLDISEIIRIIVSNGMIVYALTRKMGGKK